MEVFSSFSTNSSEFQHAHWLFTRLLMLNVGSWTQVVVTNCVLALVSDLRHCAVIFRPLISSTLARRHLLGVCVSLLVSVAWLGFLRWCPIRGRGLWLVTTPFFQVVLRFQICLHCIVTRCPSVSSAWRGEMVWVSLLACVAWLGFIAGIPFVVVTWREAKFGPECWLC